MNHLSPLEISQEQLTRLKSIKHFALDMDGTIYKGKTLFPFTKHFLSCLKKKDIHFSFLTNNPTKSTDDYIVSLKEMGIVITKKEIYTSAQATIDYLHNYFPNYKKLFILGTPNMIKEFRERGFTITEENATDCPDAIIVSFDQSLIYSRLCRAAWWISQNIPYIATNPDRICPTDQPTLLVDCGSICACLKEATGRLPDIIMGKPNAMMLDEIRTKNKLQSSQIAMIGDRIYTDIQLAHNAQVLSILVLSGEATLNDLNKGSIYPDIVIQNLGDLISLIE